MILDKENIRRYAVYVFDDKQGRADRYCDELLRGLKPEAAFLRVVVNGDIDRDSLMRFQAIADDVLILEKNENDVNVCKNGIIRTGFEKLSQYDEVIICNDKLFGPLYPLSEMFTEMNKKDIDFWGLADYRSSEDAEPARYIRSCFMVFRQSLVNSKEFRQYWKELPQTGSGNAVEEFERSFTKKFRDMGYKWEVYADSSDLEGYTNDPLCDFPGYLIEEKRCPFILKQAFYLDYGEAMAKSGGEAVREAFDYIEQNLEYDTDLIWENLLRTCNMADIKKRMQLNYVISTRFGKKPDHSIKRIALICHIYYEELAQFCRNYIDSVPSYVDVFITVPDEKRLETAGKVFEGIKNKIEFRVTGNIGRDVAPFIVGCRDVIENYDLICKVHDKKVYHVKPMSLGESWGYACFECLLANECLVENIISMFESNKRLGMAAPPIPHHGPYYPTIGKSEWGDNFGTVKELAQKLGIKADMTPDKEPNAPLGSMFWVRTDALKPLLRHEWQYSDMPKEPIAEDNTVLHGIERLYSFAVQEAGYYCAEIVSSTYAPVEINSLKYINGELIRSETKLVGKMPLKQMLHAIEVS